MADGLSGGGFGGGLALGGRQTFDMGKSYIEGEKYKAAKQAKEAKEEAAASKKFMDDISLDPKLYHRWDWDKVKEVHSNTINQLAELRAKNPTNYKNLAMPIVEKAKQELAEYQIRKQGLDEATKKAAIGMTQIGGDEYMKAYDSLTSGTPQDFAEDKYGLNVITKDEKGRYTPSVNLYPKFDWEKELTGRLSQQKADLMAKGVQNKISQPGDKEYIIGQANFKTKAEADAFNQKYGTNVMSNEEIVAGLVSSPSRFTAAEQEVKYMLPQEYNYKSTPMYSDPATGKKGRVEMVADAMMQKYGNIGAKKFEYKVAKAKPAPKTTTGTGRGGYYASEDVSVQPTTSTVESRGYDQTGYILSGRANKTLKSIDFDADNAIDKDGNKISINGLQEGIPTAVLAVYDKDKNEASYYVRLKQPKFKEGTNIRKVEAGDVIVGSNIYSRYKDAEYIYVPYDAQARSRIKALTEDKKGNTWELTQDDMDKLTKINEDLKGLKRSTDKTETKKSVPSETKTAKTKSELGSLIKGIK